MANGNETKTLTIELKGVDKSLKSTKALEKEIATITKMLGRLGEAPTDENIKKMTQSIKVLEKQVESALMETKELRKAFDDAGKAAAQTAKNTAKINKSINFIEFKRGIREASKEFVQLTTEAFAANKSVAESITDIGSGLGRVAFEFGPIGIAVGAALTVLTPFVAQFFELTVAQKAANEFTEEAIGLYAKEKVELDSLFDSLERDGITREERLEVVDKINDQYGEYLPNLLTETSTAEELAAAYDLVNNALVRKSLAQAKANAITIATTKQLNALIAAEKRRVALEAQGATAAFIKGTIGNQIAEANRIFTSTLDLINKTSASLEKQLGVVEDIGEVQNDNNKAAEDSSKLIEKENQALQKQLGLRKELAGVASILTKNSLDDVNALLKLEQEQFDEKVRQTRIRIQQEFDLNKAAEEGLRNSNILLDERKRKLEAFFALQKQFDEDREKSVTTTAEITKASGLPLDAADYAAIDTILKSSTQAQFDAELRRLGLTSDRLIAEDKILANIREAQEAYNEVNEATRQQQGLNQTAEAIRENELKQLDEAIEKRKEYTLSVAESLKEGTFLNILESNKEAYEKGLLDFQDLIDDIRAKGKVGIAALLEEIRATTQPVSDLIGKQLVDVTDNTLRVFRLTSAEIAALSDDNKVLYEQFLQSVDAGIQRLNDKRASIRDQEVAAAADFIRIVKALQTEASKETVALLEALADEQAITFDAVYKALLAKDKKYLEDKKALSQEAQDILALDLQISLDLLANQQEAELKAVLEGGLKIIEETRRQLITQGVPQSEIKKALEAEELKVLNVLAELGYKQAQKRQDVIDSFAAGTVPEPPKAEWEDYVRAFGNTFSSVFDYINVLAQNSVDAIDETIQLLLDRIGDVETKLSDSILKVATLEDDLEGKRSGRRDAVLQAIDDEKAREIELANIKIGLERELAEEEKKKEDLQRQLALQRKVQAIAQAMTKLDMKAHHQTKLKARAELLQTLDECIEKDRHSSL